MYNKTLKLMKKRYINEEKAILNFKELRTKHMKEVRNKIILESNNNTKERVKCHNLDYAIKLVCSNYKSALSNFRNGNIKHFRIKYWRYNMRIKTMDIENQQFTKKGFCHSVFGDIDSIYDGERFDLTKVDTDCKLQYDRLFNKYYLIVPEKINITENKNKREVFCGDPGIRTFITGISENNAIKIGDRCGDKIKRYLKIIDKRNNMNISNKIKKKNEKIYNRKITGLVTELHWKTIKYLTSNYRNILIGDMSVKGIINNKTSKLNKFVKRIATWLGFYKFRQRLEYKCNSYKINYMIIDESYTSKICSKCGEMKEDLGSSKIFSCDNCNVVMDRDINGARGIFIKHYK